MNDIWKNVLETLIFLFIFTIYPQKKLINFCKNKYYNIKLNFMT